MGGAFIVFATFVFKEGLAEHWKDEANTLDMIQYFVSIRHDTSVTAALLESGVQQRLLGLSGPEAPEDARVLQLKLHVMEFGDLLKRYEISTDSLRSLAARLPRDSAVRANVDAATDIQSASLKLLYETYQVLAEAMERRAARQAAGVPASPIDEKTKRDLEQKQSLLQAKVDTQTTLTNQAMSEQEAEAEGDLRKALNEAEGERARLDARSTVAWWVAAILYGIGWALALIGRVYGVPATAE